MRDFRGLRVWERSHRLAIEVNELFARAPRRGFGHVVSQTSRAALSVSTNIVEGCGHDSKREFGRYLRIALASANELEYHLLVAADLRIISADDHATFDAEARAVKRMLGVLVGRLASDDAE